jgi:hypothetical protein
MHTTRSRRIVRRAVVAFAACVLLVVSYVGSWGVLHWLMGRRTIPLETFAKVNGAIYSPLIMLENGNNPTITRFLAVFSFWCAHKGQGGPVTFSEFWEATGDHQSAESSPED